MSINHCGSYWILYNAKNVVGDNDCNCNANKANDNGNDNGINNHNYIGNVNKGISNNDYINIKNYYRTILIIMMITIVL